MNATTNLEQEYFGWAGNSIFFVAQIFQIIHTFRIKETKDISYGLQILWIIGNSMYTAFGYVDNSLSMFVGNFITLLTAFFQLSQKIYFDNFYKRNKLLKTALITRV